MKPFLPYNVLLAITLLLGGVTILYNLVLRESFATVVRYEYPEISQESSRGKTAHGAEKIAAGDETQASSPAADAQEETLQQVQFPLDINTATVEQLKLIPRIGDVMAQRIVQYRETLGGYTDFMQLHDVKGVGDKTYALLWSYLYIAAEEEVEPASQAS